MADDNKAFNVESSALWAKVLIWATTLLVLGVVGFVILYFLSNPMWGEGTSWLGF